MSKVQTSLIINATNSDGESVSKAVTNVNPDASDYSIKELGKAINDVTDNTFDSVVRVDRTNVTNTADRDPHFTVSPSTVDVPNSALNGDNLILTLSYLGDARKPFFYGRKPFSNLSVVIPSTVVIPPNKNSSMETIYDYKKIQINGDDWIPSGSNTCEMKIFLPGNEDYDDAFATVTFTNISGKGATIGGGLDG